MRAVLLTWRDSCTDGHWDHDPTHALAEIRSVGWLLHHTDELITIAQSLDGDENTAERLTVPVVTVTDITYLQ
jgi:hypothetical protein